MSLNITAFTSGVSRVQKVKLFYARAILKLYKNFKIQHGTGYKIMGIKVPLH
jgi:hypothetical protein